MELQALLVVGGVGVAVVAVLLLMSLFSASGTSYEEAIAQQRKATTELLALADNKNKPKKNKKANKKLAKKEKKEISSTATGSDPESEAPAESGVDEDTVPAAKPHVEFCPPVVVDVHRDSLPNIKTPEKKEEIVEKKEVKPTKSVKSSKAAVKQLAPSVDEPKEDVPRERHNSGDTPKEQRKVKKTEKKSISEEAVEIPKEEIPQPSNPTPIEPPVVVEKLQKQTQLPATSVPVVPAPVSSGGKNKKKKADQNVLSLMAGDSSGVNVTELVRVVREAALSRSEIQILTDALLNKQHDTLPEHSEWSEGPNDPIQKLKKQIADKEKQLADEMEASQALHAKLKELRSNLNAERSRASAVRSAAEQAAAAARAEMHTLQARLQRLLDDNHVLTQDKIVLQTKLAAEGEWQAQRMQMEMHIQRLSESEAGLVQQMNALQAEHNARALEAGQARCEAAAARDNMLMAQQHAVDLGQQLQEANRLYNELEQQHAAAVHAEQLAQQELRQTQDRLSALADLQNEVQVLTSRAQTAESIAEKSREEAEKQKQQLSSELLPLRQEVASLKEQLVLRESELAELKQMKVAPAQNGLPPSVNDQHKAAELAKVESVVESLRSELASAQRSVHDQQNQVKHLQEQLQQYQDKNNDLRTKNWKVMEALQSAEKALQTKSASAIPAQDDLREAIAKAQESQYNEIASVLRLACPTAAPSAAAGEDWLRQFADNLKKELEKKPVASVSTLTPSQKDGSQKDSSELEELKAQNEHLSGLVDKYKTIIDDTEGVLSRLQKNVTLEEQRWAKQLEEKQSELDELRQRTLIQMQNKIDSLQSELQQAKAANHNHSFADAERLTEERLMSGLAEKYKVDFSNGPLQVGLEDK